MRLVDFNIYVNIINDKTPGVLACVVEVKPYPFDKMAAGFSLHESVEKVMEEMLPQVIQQVQFAFHQFSGLQDMHALLFVAAFCKFLWFKRARVPKLPELGDIPEDGFKQDENDRRAMNNIAEPGTRVRYFRIFDGRDYSPAFKRGMDRIARFAANIPMPQQQE